MEMEHLLDQIEPLDNYEIKMLEDWLAVLESDCDLFGETPSDTHRMNRIRNRLRIERER